MRRLRRTGGRPGAGARAGKRLADHGDRQPEGELRHEVGRVAALAGLGELAEQGVHRLLDGWPECGDPAWREHLGHERPHARMVGRVGPQDRAAQQAQLAAVHLQVGRVGQPEPGIAEHLADRGVPARNQPSPMAETCPARCARW
jgi:hypothetical protein